MGHYLEPDIELVHIVNTKKSSATVFQLEYDPYSRKWTQSHSEFVPAKPSDYGIYFTPHVTKNFSLKQKQTNSLQKFLPPT